MTPKKKLRSQQEAELKRERKRKEIELIKLGKGTERNIHEDNKKAKAMEEKI